MHTLAQNMH